MKLIIDIDEDYYKAICKRAERFGSGSVVLPTSEKIILNGTQLEDIEKQIAEKSFTGNDGLDYVEMLVVCKALKGASNG